MKNAKIPTSAKKSVLFLKAIKELSDCKIFLANKSKEISSPQEEISSPLEEISSPLEDVPWLDRTMEVDAPVTPLEPSLEPSVMKDHLSFESNNLLKWSNNSCSLDTELCILSQVLYPVFKASWKSIFSFFLFFFFSVF